MYHDPRWGWSIVTVKKIGDEEGETTTQTMNTGRAGVERINILSCIQEATRARISEIIVYSDNFQEINEKFAEIDTHEFIPELCEAPPSFPTQLEC